MKKRLLVLALNIALTTGTATADELVDLYLTGKNPKLTEQEKESISISNRWVSGSIQGIKPFSGQDGSVKFLYGTQQTSIVCAVLQVCDVSLQPGESINGFNLGDRVRWHIEPAIAGNGDTEVQHLIIKPLDIGLETSLVVTTDRRTYHFKLKSHKTDYMAKISFAYPQDTQEKWKALKRKGKEKKAKKTLPKTGEYLENLDFKYLVTGKARWKPIRVYNDGVKTIIQMPSTMSQTEAPTLLVLRGNSEKDTVIVNYRVQGDRYIVDNVFDKAILIAGIGKKQDRIKIKRNQ